MTLNVSRAHIAVGKFVSFAYFSMRFSQVDGKMNSLEASPSSHVPHQYGLGEIRKIGQKVLFSCLWPSVEAAIGPIGTDRSGSLKVVEILHS